MIYLESMPQGSPLPYTERPAEVFFHAPIVCEVALFFQYNRCGQARYDG